MEPVNPYSAPLAISGVAVEAVEQPLTLVGALGAGTSLFFRRLPTLLAITLVIWVPVELIVSYQEYFVLDPDDVLGLLRWTVLSEALIGIIATGGIVSVAAADLHGEERGWLAGLGDGVRAWPRLFATRLVSGLVLIAAAVFFIVPAIYLGIRYSLSDTAAVVEGRAGMNALSRSMELTRGRFLLFLGLCIATVTPVLIANSVIYLPLSWFPEIDHWLISAALTCLIDLLDGWATLVFVAAYMQCLGEQRRAQAQADSELPRQGDVGTVE
jgi:hypothetical protein